MKLCVFKFLLNPKRKLTNDSLVEIISSQTSIAIGSNHFENFPGQLEQ